MNSKEKTMRHFNETASDYNNSDDGKFVKEMYATLVDEIQKSESGKILDVGCGNGNLFKMLPDDKYELFGVDFSKNMILEAKNSCKGKATFSVADAEMLPFEDNTFDIVVCNASFHHYIHPDAVLGEIRRVLKNGGRLLIGDPYIPTGLRSVMNVMLRFSDSGDYHIYGLKEMENLLEENGLNPLSSQKTSKRTAFYVASK